MHKKFIAAALLASILSIPSITRAAENEESDIDIAEQLFLEAIERRDAGDVFKAIRLLQSLTEARPELHRARLELAVAYHQANRYQDAIRELKAVLDNDDTPDSVRLSILAYLGQVQNDQREPEGRHLFSYFLKAGLINNSNLNASQAVATGLTTSSNAEISSIGTDFTANVSHRYSRRSLLEIANTATSVEWQSQATLNSTLYSEDSDYNLNIVTLSTGPAFISPGRWHGSAFIQADLIQLGSDHLATFVAFAPQLSFDFGNFRSLLLEASYTTHDYQDAINRDYDGSAVMIGSGFTTYLPERSVGLEAGFRLSREDAELEAYSHDLIELYAAGFYSIDERLSSYARIHHYDYQFEDNDPNTINNVIRDESELQLSLGLNYDFTEGGLKHWTLNIELSRIDSDSNADELDYERNIITANLSRYFR